MIDDFILIRIDWSQSLTPHSMQINKNVFAVIALVGVVATASVISLSPKNFAGDFSRPVNASNEDQPKKPVAKMWWGCIKYVPWTPPDEKETEETKETEPTSEEMPVINLDGAIGNIGGGNGRGTVKKDTSRQSKTVDIPDEEIPGSVKKQPGSKDTEFGNPDWQPPVCPEGYEMGYKKINDTCKSFFQRVQNGSININDPKVAKKYQEYIVICRNQHSSIDWMEMLKNPPTEKECQDLKNINDKLWKTNNATNEAKAKNIDLMLLTQKIHKCQYVYGGKKYKNYQDGGPLYP